MGSRPATTSITCLREFDNTALGDTARELGCDYDPTRNGRTWHAWLVAVQIRLTNS